MLRLFRALKPTCANAFSKHLPLTQSRFFSSTAPEWQSMFSAKYPEKKAFITDVILKENDYVIGTNVCANCLPRIRPVYPVSSLRDPETLRLMLDDMYRNKCQLSLLKLGKSTAAIKEASLYHVPRQELDLIQKVACCSKTRLHNEEALKNIELRFQALTTEPFSAVMAQKP